MVAKTFGYVVTAMVALGTGGVMAQDPVRQPMPPQIVTSAQGEVRIAPDKATINIGVQTRATTAAAAASQNSQKQRAVIDAIKAKGVPPEQIATSNFNVIPETRYDREGQTAPRTTSYLVMNNVTVELRRIDQVGPVIDAVLAAGANQINSLDFGVQSADSARRAALAQAVTKSRADAEVIARAAGGTLGSLIEVQTAESFIPRPPIPYMAEQLSRTAAVAAPIEAGQETIRATVTARWQFLPPR